VKTIALLLLVFLQLTMTTLLSANEWNDIEGTYAITGASVVDPLEDEPVNSHIRLSLSGETAKHLYDAMKAEAVVDECTGARAKNVGEMQCLFYEGDASYECYFSINIATQRIEYGIPC
jgi:hypothetical protein